MNFEKVIKPDLSSFHCFLRDDKEFDFNWHYHPEYELVLILNSSGTRHIGDNVASYSDGELVLTGPNLAHAWKSESSRQNHTAIVVHFDRFFLGKDFLDHPELKVIRELFDQAKWGLQFQSGQLVKQIETLPDLKGLPQLIAFLDILHKLSETREKSFISTQIFTEHILKKDQLRIENVFNFINNNFYKKITQQQVANIAHMSTSNFCQFFKKTTGLTFVTYLNNIRISKACELLSDTDKPVTAICLECGFENLSNFNRQFRRKKKLSPREYRNSFKI
ncbi:MAG: helix-turn-helix domain-containing protein [Phycisphaerae bacterium]|nr:helix-turn-helix domain-containing protein [Phycisphaerae bacterium]